MRLAEEASDDAAVAAAGDRASYAEVLLQFMQLGARRMRWEGVAMARYGRAHERIDRILDGTGISGGVTRFGWMAILALAAPLVYFAAAEMRADLRRLKRDTTSGSMQITATQESVSKGSLARRVP